MRMMRLHRGIRSFSGFVSRVTATCVLIAVSISRYLIIFILVPFSIWLSPGSDIRPNEFVGCVSDRLLLGAAGAVEHERLYIVAVFMADRHVAVKNRVSHRAGDDVSRLKAHVFVSRSHDLADGESAIIGAFGVKDFALVV